MHNHRGNTLRRIQSRLSQLRDEVANLGFASLGPEFKWQKASDLQNMLVAHRLLSKFEKPNAQRAERRREASIRSFLDTNASNTVSFDYRDLDRDARRTFLGAREWLRVTLLGFRPSYRFAFPSGESANSATGDTDMFDKLVREDQWTCTVDALPYAAMVAYNNLSLRRVVRDRFRQKWRPYNKTMQRKWYVEALDSGQKPGPYCFMRMFSSLCEIAPCRVTTVPKNNTKDRVITCEATWTMVAQLSLALDLRDHLRRKTGVDIRWWQDVHRALIRDPRRATIDFSEASDRNSWSVVKQLFPGNVVRHLARLRSTCVVDGEEYHPINMFAPMGAGNTFIVLTLTLLAYSRQFDPSSSVFGDDVILMSSVARDFCAFTEKLGWKVNRNKSFDEGNFRESCGAFAALDTQTLLTSYDIHWPHEIPEAYIVINKLVRVRDVTSGPLGALLDSACRDLCDLLPCNTVLREPYTSEPLWDFKILDPRALVEHRHTSLSVAAKLRMGMIQRPVVIVTRQTSNPVEVPPVRAAHRNVQLACFLRYGGIAPLTARSTKQSKKVDVWSGGPVAGFPILTVL